MVKSIKLFISVDTTEEAAQLFNFLMAHPEITRWKVEYYGMAYDVDGTDVFCGPVEVLSVVDDVFVATVDGSKAPLKPRDGGRFSFSARSDG